MKVKMFSPDEYVPNKSQTLNFKKITPNATAPVQGTPMSAGFDLFSAYDYVIQPNGTVCVKTDIMVELPIGCYGRIAPRSSLALYHSIDIGGGVVDSDYRGNVCIILFNLGKEEFSISKGDKIAQLICEKITIPKLQEYNTLALTERGTKGFGSTGMK